MVTHSRRRRSSRLALRTGRPPAATSLQIRARYLSQRRRVEGTSSWASASRASAHEAWLCNATTTACPSPPGFCEEIRRRACCRRRPRRGTRRSSGCRPRGCPPSCSTHPLLFTADAPAGGILRAARWSTDAVACTEGISDVSSVRECLLG